MARHAVEPVAAGDEVAFEGHGRAGLIVSHLRRGACQIVELDILRLFDDASAVAFPDPVQFFGDRGLPMRPHRFARVGLGVDEKRIAVLPDDEAAVMRMTFAIHAFAGAELRST